MGEARLPARRSNFKPNRILTPHSGIEKLGVIRFLGGIFRQVHWIVGITAPPPGTNERSFVLMWLAVILGVVAWGAFVLYLMLYVF